MQTADNLLQCNHYFRARAEQWRRLGKDARWLRVKVAKIFTRLAYAVVAGRLLFPHPCRQGDHYLLGKLLAFHVEHRTDPAQVRQDMQAAAQQLPPKARAGETKQSSSRPPSGIGSSRREPRSKKLVAAADRGRPPPMGGVVYGATC